MSVPVITELKNELWVATPKGDMLARFMIYHGLDHGSSFLCEAESNGAFWEFHREEVRVQRNFTRGFGRKFPAGVKRKDFDPATFADPERP